jgi:hypothetical protein
MPDGFISRQYLTISWGIFSPVWLSPTQLFQVQLRRTLIEYQTSQGLRRTEHNPWAGFDGIANP